MNKSGAAHRATGDSGGPSRHPGATLLENWPDSHADLAGLATAMSIFFKTRQLVIINRSGPYYDVRH